MEVSGQWSPNIDGHYNKACMGEKSKRESQEVRDRNFGRSVKDELTTEWGYGIREMSFHKKRIPFTYFRKCMQKYGVVKNQQVAVCGCWGKQDRAN